MVASPLLPLNVHICVIGIHIRTHISIRVAPCPSPGISPVLMFSTEDVYPLVGCKINQRLLAWEKLARVGLSFVMGGRLKSSDVFHKQLEALGKHSDSSYVDKGPCSKQSEKWIRQKV